MTSVADVALMVSRIKELEHELKEEYAAHGRTEKERRALLLAAEHDIAVIEKKGCLVLNITGDIPQDGLSKFREEWDKIIGAGGDWKTPIVVPVADPTLVSIGKPQVPCGVGVVIERNLGRKGLFILLGQRKGAHGAGEWSLPGGRLEPGERPRVCGARELEEETGIEIHPERLLLWEHCPHVNTITGGEPWVTLFYWFAWEDTDNAPKVMEPDKCVEWRWFEVSDLPDPLFEAFAELARRTGWR